MTGKHMISNDEEQRSLKAYEAPQLVHLDHRATQSGAPGLTSDANETIINVAVTSSSAPS